MAYDELESVEETNTNRKFPFCKRKNAVFISTITGIVIMLCIIILLYTNFLRYLFREHATNKQLLSPEDNVTTFITTSKYLNNIRSTTSQSQIPGSQHKIIYRDKWGGRAPLYEHPQKLPVKYVIISHTAGAECFSITDCSKKLVLLQSLHIGAGSPDIGYNFLGGDSNIYVGRGWDNHNFHMNLDTIGICFIGNYVFNELNPEMIEATQQLLKMGIKEGKLDKDYILLAHNQTYNTISPGPNVYKQIKFWPHFSPDILTDNEKDKK